MNRSLALVLYAVLSTFAPASAQAQTSSAAVPACAANQIALNADADDGAFDGASHGGTVIVLRNASRSTCNLAGRIPIVLEDRANVPLHVTVDIGIAFKGPIVSGRRLPMGHGPVLLPIIVPPGKAATSKLRWVSAPVFDRSVCEDPAYLTARIAGSVLRTNLHGHVCGPDADHLTVRASQLTVDAAPAP